MGHIELLDAYNNVINEWKDRTENENGDVLDLIDRDLSFVRIHTGVGYY